MLNFVIYHIKLIYMKLRVKMMSYNDTLYYAYRRRYRVIGTCGGYRIQYIGFLLKDNNHHKVVFPTLEDMVIFLSLNN